MKIIATTALPAPFVLVVSCRSAQIVHTMNDTSIPAVLVRNSGRRPILSTKKHMVTATMKLKIWRTPLMISCVVESVMPIEFSTGVM